MKLFDLEIIGQGHSLCNKGQKGQSHEMRIVQKVPLKNQNSKWCQFLKKAQNGHFKGLEGT